MAGSPILQGINTGLQVYDTLDRASARKEDRARLQRQDTLALEDRERRIGREDKQDAWAEEDRGIRMADAAEDRKFTKDERGRAERQRELNGALWEMRSALETGKPWTMDAGVERLMRAGADGNTIRRLANPDNQKLAAAMGNVLKEGRQPNAEEMAIFNSVNKQFINANVGEELEKDIVGKDGKVVAPKGSRRIDTEAMGFGPTEKGSLNMGLKVRVRPPGAPDDGSQDVTYMARRTPGGSANGPRGAKDIEPEELADGIDLGAAGSQVFQPGPELEALISQYEGLLAKEGGNPAAIDPGKRGRDKKKADQDYRLGEARIGAANRSGRGGGGVGSGKGRYTRVNASTMWDNVLGKAVSVNDPKARRDYNKWIVDKAIDLETSDSPPEIDTEETVGLPGTTRFDKKQKGKPRKMTRKEIIEDLKSQYPFDEDAEAAPEGTGLVEGITDVVPGAGLAATGEPDEYVTRGSGRSNYGYLFGEDED